MARDKTDRRFLSSSEGSEIAPCDPGGGRRRTGLIVLSALGVMLMLAGVAAATPKSSRSAIPKGPSSLADEPDALPTATGALSIDETALQTERAAAPRPSGSVLKHPLSILTSSTPGWEAGTGPGPSPRNGAASAFDAASGQVVYFGGSSSSDYRTVQNDTWVYTQGVWTEVHPTSSPPARAGAVMAYDPIARTVVLFGGYGADRQDLGDTWTWDGSDWHLQAPALSPSARADAAIAWDPVTASVVLFGGRDDTTHSDLADTWNWNGVQWAEQMPPIVPAPRSGASLGFDPMHGQLLLFGGASETTGDLNDTWMWDGTRWWSMMPKASPSRRDGAAVTVTGDLGELLLVGGYQASDHRDLADTWMWTGSNWKAQTTPASPSARFGASAVLDDATRQVVLLGGTTGANVFLDGGNATSGQAARGWWTWREPTKGDPVSEPPRSTPDGGGYWLASSTGRTYGFGNAWVSSAWPAHLNKPIVGVRPTPDGVGYWLYAADGGVFTYGDARFFGSAGSDALRSPVVAMAVTRDGGGYWLATANGQVLSYGDAPAIRSSPSPHGSAPVLGPVVGIAATADDRGYWLATATGQVIAAGDAKVLGTVSAAALGAPVAALAATADGGGYWLVTLRGAVYNFGDAGWYGSTATMTLDGPVDQIIPCPEGDGYWLTARDGGVFTFGRCVFHGSLGGLKLPFPIV